jgi:drug/metabolite transporter (DMT)-like permease
MTAAKMWVQVLFAALAAIVPALVVGWPPSPGGWINIVILAAGALMVFNAGNLPGWSTAKTIASAISAVAVVLVSALSDNMIGPDEVIQMILAFGAALGVYITPNAGATVHHAG